MTQDDTERQMTKFGHFVGEKNRLQERKSRLRRRTSRVRLNDRQRKMLKKEE